MEVKEQKFDYKKNIEKTDFEKLYGQGGSFLISPLNRSKMFSKEMFSEDQKMFADAAYEYATTRMRPLKDKLSTLNEELTLEISVLGFLKIEPAGVSEQIRVLGPIQLSLPIFILFEIVGDRALRPSTALRTP